MGGGGMSYPARDPRSGIDGKANAAGHRQDARRSGTNDAEGGGMSYPARDPRSGIDGKANAAGHRQEGFRMNTQGMEVAA
jgi:hypothetical protein